MRLNNETKNVLLTPGELTTHIEGCAKNNRESQKKLYSSFYGYALAICDRYASGPEDAVEILNDGFLKIFKEISRFTPAYKDVSASFTGWLRKIMIYTAIDHFRKNKKHLQIGHIDPSSLQVASSYESVIDKISHQEILQAVQQLSPAYQMVFNLFVIEGMSHEEISNILGIAQGTSKSNLSKARAKLKQLLNKQSELELNRYVI